MKNLPALIVLAVALLGLTGCGVIGGAGQDISSAGHVVTRSANAVKHTMSY